MQQKPDRYLGYQSSMVFPTLLRLYLLVLHHVQDEHVASQDLGPIQYMDPFRVPPQP